MFAFLVRRVFAGVIMLIVMSLVVFGLFFASPVDVAAFACGKNCSPAIKEQTRKALGYDDPTLVQWKDFMVGIAKGREYPNDPELREAAPQLVASCDAPCFGYSQVNSRTVNEEISKAFPITVSLAVVALIIWLTVGIALGCIAALTKGSFLDRGLVGISLVFYAFPTFFIGLLLLKFVSIKWGLWDIPEYTSIADGGVGAWLYNLILPSVTLAVVFMAAYVRMTRAFVLEAMSEDYIRTAHSKGLSRGRVLRKHTLRAALTPLVTMAGLDFAGLLGGAIITEYVFNFNGLGKLAVDANQNYDLPTIIGLVVLAASFVILMNIIVDVLYAVIDPRVRLG
ncbi:MULTISPECIES: ABC transporter permease [unclassified Nocardioides]|uniref:ABC transporter permease n=1 Tax=unclassified Nocardioides TaxID=2615069 RepID=UPI0007038DBF|nr:MULTISPECIES: ABC transporter permease [unclassified Nocardioides]KRC49013.1 ABC transporter permease [Nocardioides sp. Root79]KRC75414.1 ABC transporter permease [Nocardioides sp. Root240]